MNEIRIGDCREIMKTLIAEGVKVQTCITSPPYFGLRDYGTGKWDGGDPACDHTPPRTQGANGQRAEDGESCGNHPNGATDSLTGVTRNWPTPLGTSKEGGRSEKHGAVLDQEARNWPTPNTPSGGPNTESTESHTGGMDLDGAVLKWPPAGANDWRGSAAEGQRRGQLDEAAEQIFSLPDPAIPDGQPSSTTSRGSRRRLNPAFAAWLMGMPPGWTET